MADSSPRGEFLTHFDFSSIEEMDPSLEVGHKVVYDRDVPFELRLQEVGGAPQEVGTIEAIRCKILVMGDTGSPQHIKVEVTSENDLFLHYTHSVDTEIFQKMQEGQKLVIDFANYITILIKMFNSCIHEPHSFLAILIMQNNGQARLDFIQNMEYKFLELLSCDFSQSNEDVTRHHIQFRYNSMKSKLALMQARLQDVNALIKVKNPSLLLQLRRHAQQQACRQNNRR